MFSSRSFLKGFIFYSLPFSIITSPVDFSPHLYRIFSKKVLAGVFVRHCHMVSNTIKDVLSRPQTGARRNVLQALCVYGECRTKRMPFWSNSNSTHAAIWDNTQKYIGFAEGPYAFFLRLPQKLLPASGSATTTRSAPLIIKKFIFRHQRHVAEIHLPAQQALFPCILFFFAVSAKILSNGAEKICIAADGSLVILRLPKGNSYKLHGEATVMSC